MLKSIGLQRVRHDWATELNCTGCLPVKKLTNSATMYKDKTSLEIKYL